MNNIASKRIIELRPEAAVTTFASVKILRDYPTKAVTQVELENCVSQAVWKFFTRCRSEAANRLGISEMELALTDARILGIKIDGHQVINPNGFTGRELEIKLGISMVKQDVPREAGYLIEGATARAYLLARSLGERIRAFYVEVSERNTDIVALDGSHVFYLSGFDWGGKDILAAVTQVLDLEGEVSRHIYHKYTQSDVSDKFSRRMDKAFYLAFNSFLAAMTLHTHGVGGLRPGGPQPLYLNARFPVPDGVYRRRFNLGKGRGKFMKPEVNFNIAEFFADSIHEVYSDLNELACRRIQWSMPNGQ